jgi:hypothetical protein
MEVKVYSKLKLVNALNKRGLYFRLRDFLQNTAGGLYWDLFTMAQDIRSDNAQFTEMIARIQEALEVSGDLVGEILAESEME